MLPRLNRTALRRRQILELLGEQEVKSQEELARLLGARGFGTTQPMLSRDLRALRVAKRDGAYQIVARERVTPLAELAPLLRGARQAGANLVVVQCEPGAARALARALEAEELDGFVGSVAGDDTILVAVNSSRSGAKVRRFVHSLLEVS